MGTPDFFNRCEYDAYMNGSKEPVKRTYIVRNYGGGEACIDACIEMQECRTSCFEIVEHRNHGDFLPHTVEFLNQDKTVVLKICNFRADEKTYSYEELLQNPELLPNGDVLGFQRFYGTNDYR